MVETVRDRCAGCDATVYEMRIPLFRRAEMAEAISESFQAPVHWQQVCGLAHGVGHGTGHPGLAETPIVDTGIRTGITSRHDDEGAEPHHHRNHGMVSREMCDNGPDTRKLAPK